MNECVTCIVRLRVLMRIISTFCLSEGVSWFGHAVRLEQSVGSLLRCRKRENEERYQSLLKRLSFRNHTARPLTFGKRSKVLQKKLT